MAEQIRCELVSWERFYNLCRKLVFDIRESGFQPDIIVAIGRGGYVPARILSDYLDIMNLASFKIEHYLGAQKKGVAAIRYSLPEEVEGRRVLLVDDVSDSGDTFSVAHDHVYERIHPDEIKTAVLHHKIVSSYEPDFYAEKVMQWRWIIYPWAVMEDVSGFLDRMQPRPENAEEAREALLRNHDLNIPAAVLNDLFRSV